jgi:hypothetical protein
VAAYFCCALDPFCQITGRGALIMSGIAFTLINEKKYTYNTLNNYTRAIYQQKDTSVKKPS